GRRRRAHGRLARAGAAAQARPGPDPHGARRRLRGRARAGGGGVRPLDRLPSIKLKLGVVILAAVLVTVVVVTVGQEAGISPVLTGLGAAVLALAMVQFLAHGMTYPLREMVAATRAMAKGDYDVEVTATSRDEVGELARAFNTMSRELAEVDRFRRDLVANASHELRTPLGALRARLENLVDGIEPADSAALADPPAQVARLGQLVRDTPAPPR